MFSINSFDSVCKTFLVGRRWPFCLFVLERLLGEGSRRMKPLIHLRIARIRVRRIRERVVVAASTCSELAVAVLLGARLAALELLADVLVVRDPFVDLIADVVGSVDEFLPLADFFWAILHLFSGLHVGMVIM